VAETLYILRPDYPRELRYPSGAIRLEIAELPRNVATHGRRWVFRAAKLSVPGCTCDIAFAMNYRWRMDELLHQSGFVLASETAAARIMNRLVRDGYAFARRATSRDWK
jgi:hypothetical protein